LSSANRKSRVEEKKFLGKLPSQANPPGDEIVGRIEAPREEGADIDAGNFLPLKKIGVEVSIWSLSFTHRRRGDVVNSHRGEEYEAVTNRGGGGGGARSEQTKTQNIAREKVIEKGTKLSEHRTQKTINTLKT